MRTPVLIAAFAAASALAAGAAWACSCIPQASAEAQLAQADVAFVGRVIETRAGPDAASDNPYAEVTTRFAVSRTLKGEALTEIAVQHLPGELSATCGVDFQPGRDILVLAHARGDKLTTGLCSLPQFPLADFERAVTEGTARADAVAN